MHAAGMIRPCNDRPSVEWVTRLLRLGAGFRRGPFRKSNADERPADDRRQRRQHEIQSCVAGDEAELHGRRSSRAIH